MGQNGHCRDDVICERSLNKLRSTISGGFFIHRNFPIGYFLCPNWCPRDIRKQLKENILKFHMNEGNFSKK